MQGIYCFVIYDIKGFIIADNSILKQSKMTATPSVSWAQREKIVFVTINVSDVKEPEIKVTVH